MPVYIANLVEDALVVLPTVLLALASCIFVRRRKDPARSAFLWLHIALIIYLVQLILKTVRGVMAVVDISGGDLYSFSRVTIWFRFLRALAAVAISLTVFEIGHGIYLCATGKSLKAIRYTLLAYGFVLSAISLGTSGAWEQLITDILNDEENFFPYYVDDYYYGRRRPLVILNVIIAVFCMLMSLAVTALSIWFTSAVRHSEKSDVLGQATTVLLVSALLNLVAWTWGIPPAVWVVQEEYPSVWWSAVTGVFDNWTLFVSLVLIFVMGLRKKKGIWSTPRPWTQPEGAVVRPMPMPSMVPQPAAPPGAVVPPMASPGMYYVPFYVPYYGAQPVWSANAPPPSGQDAPAAQPTYPQTAVTHGNAASPAPGA